MSCLSGEEKPLQEGNIRAASQVKRLCRWWEDETAGLSGNQRREEKHFHHDDSQAVEQVTHRGYAVSKPL